MQIQKSNSVGTVVLCVTSPEEEIIHFGVEREWLGRFLFNHSTDENHQPVSLEKFMEEYTSEDSMQIYSMAILANKLAFVHSPESEEPLQICGANENWKVIALVDYISQMLQGAGYEAASKYVDCAFSL